MIFECEVVSMDEKANVTEQTTAPTAEHGNIMQHIQDMIGDLLKNAVDKMHKTDTGDKLGGTHPITSDNVDATAQMGIPEVKNFVSVMQKFIDNVNVMIMQIETGNLEHGNTDDQFIDGYMATADNILEMAAFSMKDPVTGLSNKYGFDNRLILEWNRATRDKSALSLVIFSVGGFEDCENIITKDDLLKTVSNTLVKSIKRTTDFLARWSDNEFAALLPFTNTDGASIVSERLYTEIGNMAVPGIAESDKRATVSIGICVHSPEPHEQPVNFIKKAHDAFVEAKAKEGNTTIFA